MVQLKSGAPLAARWDKLKSVNLLADEINSKIKSLDVDETPITLDIGPQLMHTLRHPSSLKCLDHSSSKLGETFTTHCNKGALQMVKVWTLETKDKNGVIKQKTFETNCEITSMTFVSKHRVYMVFCSDLTLRVFTDSNSNFVEVQCIEYLTTILCLVYNKEEDEVYAGGIGFIEEWKIQGAEHAALAIPGRKFVTELTRNEWIRDIQVDKHKRQMFAVHGNGICVINMKTRQQVRKLPNRHDGPLRCCCYYYPNDFLVTGGSDGKLKLFNGTAFNLLHVLTGHHGPITSVLPHKTDTLLFSASFDGSVRIWRMESLQMFMRLDMGEKIYHLSLIGSTEFFFGTEKNVLIYNLNQFYQMFAPVESETKKLMRCTGRGKCSRILGSTEDGSVRLFSPVTGLTLTMVYPMPSFQVLMSFSYDMHQDKLHVVLTGGKVLVYDTSTNPCTVEELWEPTSEDEKEFTCKDGGLDIDNLVFAGLENGQIILCESVVCTLQHPVQAHEGNIVCLEKCFQMTSKNLGLLDTTNMIISGGTDNFVKIWFIDVNTENHRPLVNMVQTMKIYLVSVPTHISMFGCHLCVVIKAGTEQGVRWSLIMYQMVSLDSETKVDKQVYNLLNMSTRVPYQLTHSPDEDHCKEITALDVCPIIGTILTAGRDGFVKVWSCKNELLKEMNFVSPIYASCFANNRGDILVGYGANVCSVSVVNYLPVSYLGKVLYIAQITRLQEDKRELPVTFDHNCQPLVELSNVKKYSINIFERRRQHLEEDVVKRLKKEKEATKFVIFSDGGTTKVIAKDLADKLLFWAKGKHKLQIGKKALIEFTSLSDVRSTEDHKNTVAEKKKSESKKNDGYITLKDKPEEKEFLDSQGLIEIYPSAVGKALSSLEAKPRRQLTAEEMRLLSEAELLKKDPIIAPDGYIPNSVIRRKLKPRQIDPPIRFDRPFKLKPVPKINPHHLPSWWGKEEEEDREATTPSGWEDSSSSEKPDTTLGLSQPSTGREAVQQSPTSPTRLTSGRRYNSGIPYSPYQLRSRKMDLYKVDLRMSTPDGRKGKSGRTSVERTKSFKLTNLAVDEDSSAIHVKDSKSGRRSRSNLESDIIQRLLGEKWMPKMEGEFEYEDVLNALIGTLDNNNPVVYDNVCKYLTNIFKELGLPDAQLDKALSKLGMNLNNVNSALKKYTLQTLQVLGEGRKDIVLLILPKLVDPEEPIRKAAAEAITVLTGAQDKDTLFAVLDEMGLTSGIYDSKEDEAKALQMLADRFNNKEDESQHFDRIQDWVLDTTPGFYEEEVEDEDAKGKDGKQSRKTTKELSSLSGKSGVMSDGKSGRKDTNQDTPRSGSTLKKRFNEMDGFSTISDRSSLSRKSKRSGRFTPRDPHLYRYYNHQKGQTPRAAGRLDTHEGDGNEDKLSGDRLGEKDSDFHSISNVASSQISDRLSGYDSGIARDMSEYSQGRSGAGYGHRKEQGTGKGYTYGAPLSPVKSETSSKGRHSARSLHASHSKGSHSARAANKGHGKGSRSARSANNDSTEWRKFFDQLPNVMERRQMEQIKKEMEQGKLKAAVLPPVSYFADDIPMLPGEAGTRLLQTVQVGKKMPHPSDCKYQIESVPGKLAMHTKNGGGGLSHFGILEMKWTTGRPTVRDKLEPPQLIAPYRSPESKLQQPDLMAPYQSLESKLQDPYLLSMSGHHRVRNDISEEELNLPRLSAGLGHAPDGPSPNHYEWELPLPPPPAKESRTNIPHIKKAHDSYCKYYELVKKKLHLYTSQKREKSLHLPEVLVKRIQEEPTENTGSPVKLLSPSKTALGSQLFLPPIKLGQLVKMY